MQVGPFSLARGLPPAAVTLAYATLALGALLTITIAPAPAAACGPDTDCKVGDRTYRIRMPENLKPSEKTGDESRQKPGAILYMHGYRGSAANVMRNKSLGKTISKAGLALIAPTPVGPSWAIPGTPSGIAPVDVAYIQSVLDDVVERHGIDPDRIMATGFSAGGMVTWNLICDLSDRFIGLAPIAGTFWAPVPDGCKAPAANVMHIHGTADRMVPLEGRPIGPTRQGSVPKTLQMYSDHGGFTSVRSYKDGDLDCERKENTAGNFLEYCLHAGGHSLKTRFVMRAWNAFASTEN